MQCVLGTSALDTASVQARFRVSMTRAPIKCARAEPRDDQRRQRRE
jgi:hypothetical protein